MHAANLSLPPFLLPTPYPVHTLFKKLVLEINWQFAQYLSRLGVIDDASGFILHAQPLIVMTMYGRIMQASSDNIVLTIVLELGSIAAEVFEARDLLRLDTPLRRYYKKAIWVLQGVGLMRSPAGQVVPAGSNDSGNANDGSTSFRWTTSASTGSAGAEDGMDLRQRFCSDVLIATQMAEVSEGISTFTFHICGTRVCTRYPPVYDTILDPGR